MKILHIITGLNDGGAEAVLYRLCLADKINHHEVISLMDAGRYGPMLEEHGIPVTCLGLPRGRATFRGMWRLWSAIGKVKPDVVQTWMYHANLLGGVMARLVGLSNVVWGLHHTTLVPGATGSSTRIVDRLCARLSRVVPKAIVACAHEAQRVHVANGYDARKFIIIPNGYDVLLFSPDQEARTRIRHELGIASQAQAIGLVGRWDPQKDHSNLIAALQIVKQSNPDLHLILAGTQCTSDNPDLIKLLQSADCSRNIHLLGQRADVPALMNALDLHVLSSYSEAFPNVLAEAMACGTPCVSTDVGDARLILGETGWIVPPRNPEALAEVLKSALGEQGRPDWKVRQDAARRRIMDHLTIAQMVNRYREVWYAGREFEA